MSYIDDAFLEDFSKLKPTDIESAGDELEIWRNWFMFVQHKTDIDLTIKSTIEDLAYDVNASLIKRLIDDYYQGKTHIAINTNKLENSTARDLVLNSDKPTFIFRNDLKNSEITEEKTGICCINGASFFDDWAHYYKSKAYSISKAGTQNQLEKWGDLFAHYRYPSNAFVITDNYIFTNKPNIKNNLLKIIKELLLSSKRVCTEIDLIIVAEKFYQEDNEDVSLDKLYREVTKHLRDALFLNVNLCIIKAKYHDRLILSNYFAINSGNSFSYFNYDAVTILPQNTRLSLTPYSYDYSYIDTYKSELLHIIEQCQEYKGTKRNRLLKLLV